MHEVKGDDVASGKVVTVIGARPQFVKAAVVSRAVTEHSKLNEVIVHTGQHYDSNMSEIFFTELKIPKPKFHLGIGDQTHGAMTGQMLEKLESLFVDEKPELVLVYGDTNSTLAGALAAAKLKIPVAHVEAGLRSFNPHMPEEINRALTDRVSSLLLCPTLQAIKNLEAEGLRGSKVHNVGDVMYDASLYYREMAKVPDSIRDTIKKEEKFILCTIHRAENTDNEGQLKGICEAINELALTSKVVMPIHPRTKKALEKLNFTLKNTVVIPPVGYLEMIYLLSNCEFVMTDSGGLQKEAYFFKKPCLTMRSETEWVETLDAGCNFLVGSEKEKILESAETMREREFNFSQELYGDGNSGSKIVKIIEEFVS